MFFFLSPPETFPFDLPRPATLMAASCLALVLCALGQQPFAYSLDQSIPCPRGSNQDSSLAFADEGRPIARGDDRGVDNVLERIDTFLSEKVLQLGSAAAGIAVMHNGNVLNHSWAGSAWANRSSGAPTLGLDSGFMIASLTKTFAAVSLFKIRQ